jgi:hypothetical protein
VEKLKERHPQDIEGLPRYYTKENLMNRILFHSYKDIFDEVKEDEEMGTRSCIRIWNSSDKILEYFWIELMVHIEEEFPNELEAERCGRTQGHQQRLNVSD